MFKLAIGKCMGPYSFVINLIELSIHTKNTGLMHRDIPLRTDSLVRNQYRTFYAFTMVPVFVCVIFVANCRCFLKSIWGRRKDFVLKSQSLLLIRNLTPEESFCVRIFRLPLNLYDNWRVNFSKIFCKKRFLYANAATF